MILSQCAACKHRILPEKGRGWQCPAFPDGIPEEITANRRLHDHPYPDDHGVRWEAKSEELGRIWETGLQLFEQSHPGWRRQRERREGEREVEQER